jgi:hypothetical protein
MLAGGGRGNARPMCSTSREFYPGVLQAFDDWHQPTRWRCPPLRLAIVGPTTFPSGVASALRGGGRRRRVDKRAAAIHAALAHS